MKFDSFSSLNLCDRTQKALDKMGYKIMTHSQHHVLKSLIEDKFMCAHVNAKTGSGKTIMYLIHTLELLNELDFKRHNGKLFKRNWKSALSCSYFNENFV